MRKKSVFEPWSQIMWKRLFYFAPVVGSADSHHPLINQQNLDDNSDDRLQPEYHGAVKLLSLWAKEYKSFHYK
jgi:hypothetical protein